MRSLLLQVNQSFFCDFILTCSWFEPTLKGKISERAEHQLRLVFCLGIPTGQVDWDLVFDPQIDIRNAFDVQLMSTRFGCPQSTRFLLDWTHDPQSFDLGLSVRFAGWMRRLAQSRM